MTHLSHGTSDNGNSTSANETDETETEKCVAVGKGVSSWAATWQSQQCECAPSKYSDQPGHSPSLIRVFAVRMKKAWVLSYPLSAQRRLWSDWADAQADLSLRWAHTHFVGFVMSRRSCCWPITEPRNDKTNKMCVRRLSKFMPKVAYMHNNWCTCWWILTRFACCACNIVKWWRLNRFWWPWPNFLGHFSI